MKGMRREAGFTLPELLVTVAVFVLFGVGATLLLSPDDHAPEARNGQRWMGVALLSQGLRRYQEDHGKLPDNLPGEAKIISSEAGGYNLCPSLVPAYMDDLPLDPQSGLVVSQESCETEGVFYISGFTIHREKGGKVVVTAPAAENGDKISLVIVAAGVRYE